MQTTIYIRVGTNCVSFGNLCDLIISARTELALDDVEYRAEYRRTYEGLISDVESGLLRLQDCRGIDWTSVEGRQHIGQASILVSDLHDYLQPMGIAIAPMLEIELPAVVSEIPMALQELPQRAIVFVTDRIDKRHSFSGFAKAGDLIATLQDRISQQHKGFYTVHEAAQLLANANPGIDVRDMADRISMATVNGHSMLRDKGSRMPVYGIGKGRLEMKSHLVKATDVNLWLSQLGVDYGFPPENLEPLSPSNVVHPAETVPHTHLVSRSRLIEVFGAFTGMNASWFKNLKDTPSLLAARKVAGQGSRGSKTEPKFCPFEVMQWLTNPKRRKGQKLSTEKGWELLEKHFLNTYNFHSVCDPRPDK